jgi:transcriptional regulator with XRE-family HTH domain
MPRTRKSRYDDEYRMLLTMLIEQRVRSGVTQVELAARIGTSQSILSKLERGVVRVDLSDLLDYLDGVGSDPLAFVKDFMKRARRPKPDTGSTATEHT